MAFPSIGATNSGNSGASTTTHTVNLPAGITSGQLLIVAFCNGGASTASVTTPGSGWSTRFTNTFNAAGGPTLTVFYRFADGSEGSTITVTTSGSAGSSHVSYRITGVDTGTNPESGTSSENQSSTPDPPTVTASWGSADNLFLAMVGWEPGSQAVTGYPTNYTLSQTLDRWNSGSGSGTIMAGRQLASATDNPGTFSSPTVNWVAGTVVIKPGAGGIVTGNPWHYYAQIVSALSVLVMFFRGVGA